MTDSEFVKRIDAEMARTNEVLEQDRVAWRREMAAHGDSLQDIRFEMRQMSQRGERLAHGYLRALESMTDEIRANTQAARDISDQVRANTRGLLRVLDRFDAGGGPATAAG